MISYKRTDSNDPGFREMVALLDEGLTVTDGDEFDFFAQFNKIDNIRNVIVAFDGELAVGAGSFKEFDNETAEIKRMFVRESHRRLGIAATILRNLEEWAVESGYKYSMLETGCMLIGAIAMYKREGYSEIDAYEPYVGVATSVCMKKELKP